MINNLGKTTTKPRDSPSSTSAAPCASPEKTDKKKSKPVKVVKRTHYQKKPKVLLIGDSIAHNANFREVEIVTNTTIQTCKA